MVTFFRIFTPYSPHTSFHHRFRVPLLRWSLIKLRVTLSTQSLCITLPYSCYSDVATKSEGKSALSSTHRSVRFASCSFPFVHSLTTAIHTRKSVILSFSLTCCFSEVLGLFFHSLVRDHILLNFPTKMEPTLPQPGEASPPAFGQPGTRGTWEGYWTDSDDDAPSGVQPSARTAAAERNGGSHRRIEQPPLVTLLDSTAVAVTHTPMLEPTKPRTDVGGSSHSGSSSDQLPIFVAYSPQLSSGGSISSTSGARRGPSAALAARAGQHPTNTSPSPSRGTTTNARNPASSSPRVEKRRAEIYAAQQTCSVDSDDTTRRAESQQPVMFTLADDDSNYLEETPLPIGVAQPQDAANGTDDGSHHVSVVTLSLDSEATSKTTPSTTTTSSSSPHSSQRASPRHIGGSGGPPIPSRFGSKAISKRSSRAARGELRTASSGSSVDAMPQFDELPRFTGLATAPAPAGGAFPAAFEELPKFNRAASTDADVSTLHSSDAVMRSAGDWPRIIADAGRRRDAAPYEDKRRKDTMPTRESPDAARSTLSDICVPKQRVPASDVAVPREAQADVPPTWMEISSQSDSTAGDKVPHQQDAFESQSFSLVPEHLASAGRTAAESSRNRHSQSVSALSNSFASPNATSALISVLPVSLEASGHKTVAPRRSPRHAQVDRNLPRPRAVLMTAPLVDDNDEPHSVPAQHRASAASWSLGSEQSTTRKADEPESDLSQARSTL